MVIGLIKLNKISEFLRIYFFVFVFELFGDIIGIFILPPAVENLFFYVNDGIIGCFLIHFFYKLKALKNAKTILFVFIIIYVLFVLTEIYFIGYSTYRVSIVEIFYNLALLNMLISAFIFILNSKIDWQKKKTLYLIIIPIILYYLIFIVDEITQCFFWKLEENKNWLNGLYLLDYYFLVVVYFCSAYAYWIAKPDERFLTGTLDPEQ